MQTTTRLRVQNFDPLMPSEITLADVLGFSEILGETGFNVPVSKRFFRGSSEFISLLASSRMLGLVSREENHLVLTSLGVGFLKADYPEKMGILRVRLSGIEPFKSAFELFSGNRSASALDVARMLSRKYAMGDFDPNRIRLVLIEWGIGTGLLEFTSGDEFRASCCNQ